MRRRAWHIPLRLATGAFILNSGIGKRSADEARATALRTSASFGFPSFAEVEPQRFIDLLSRGEIALGAALLAPFVPSWLAGAALGAFSGGLLRMYLRNPNLHLPGSIRPSPQGTAISKDIWMFAIALALLIDGLGDRP